MNKKKFALAVVCVGLLFGFTGAFCAEMSQAPAPVLAATAHAPTSSAVTISAKSSPQGVTSLALPSPAAALGKKAQGAPSLAPAQPAQSDDAIVADEAVRGQTLMLVGTRGSRAFILEETVRVARQLGLRLLLLDKPENRKNSGGVIPDSDFIAAPIDRRDEATMKAIAKQVEEFAKTRKIDVVAAFRSHHARLVGKIVDTIGAKGVPGKPVTIADDKAKTREALNVIPELAVPSRKIKSAEEARQAYRELGGGKFVMKSNHGENSRFVVLGIDSEDKMAEEFAKMDAELKKTAKQKESSDTIFNRYPGILVERMLEMVPGSHESSVEMVVRNGKVMFAMVSDTHGIGPKEELAGGSLTFPSQQPQSSHAAFIAAAAKALQVIGIRDGNARVDMMMTKDGARVIEVNPYLGGAAIWKAVKITTGISLVEWGIRSLFHLSLPTAPQPNKVVDYRFAASQYTGEILSIEGEAEAKQTPGVEHVQLLAGPGDKISAPIGNGYEEWAEVMGVGQTFEEAKKRSVEALGKIKAAIKIEETGDYLQPKK